MIEHDLEYEELEYSIHIVEGQITEGTYFAEEIMVVDESENPEDSRAVVFDLGSLVRIADIKSALIESAINKIFELEDKIDTSNRDYTEPRFVSEGTNLAKVLQSVYNLFPCTNKMIRDQSGIDHDVSGYVSDLKNDGLVACVGWHNRSQILVPTHIGMKEIYCLNETPNPYKEDTDKGGLEALFSETYPKDEEEEEAAS